MACTRSRHAHGHRWNRSCRSLHRSTHRGQAVCPRRHAHACVYLHCAGRGRGHCCGGYHDASAQRLALGSTRGCANHGPHLDDSRHRAPPRQVSCRDVGVRWRYSPTSSDVVSIRVHHDALCTLKGEFGTGAAIDMVFSPRSEAASGGNQAHPVSTSPLPSHNTPSTIIVAMLGPPSSTAPKKCGPAVASAALHALSVLMLKAVAPSATRSVNPTFGEDPDPTLSVIPTPWASAVEKIASFDKSLEFNPWITSPMDTPTPPTPGSAVAVPSSAGNAGVGTREPASFALTFNAAPGGIFPESASCAHNPFSNWSGMRCSLAVSF
eukprot:m.190707 g.190707  ORF g.190707 m.190707 type:complete len:323 (+) comp24894_c0_seq1:1207-2175(+)